MNIYTPKCRGQPTTTHSLFLYGLGTKNVFYMFKKLFTKKKQIQQKPYAACKLQNNIWSFTVKFATPYI